MARQGVIERWRIARSIAWGIEAPELAKAWTIMSVAGRSLSANKLRSALTMLGIIIGVAAVIVMLSIGRGAQNAITAQLQGLGTNLLFVLPGSASVGGIRAETGTVGTLTLEDAYALADPLNVPAVLAVAPTWTGTGQVVYQGENMRTRILGVTPEFSQVRNTRVVAGEFIQQAHVAGRSNVALLGSVVAERLFPNEDPIGQWIRINNAPFRVIGVLESKGVTGFVNQDDVVMVPITTALSRFAPGRGLNSITGINVQVVSADQMDAAVEQISAVLRQRHRILYEDDFAVIGQREIMSTAEQIIGIFTFFLGGVAAISLVVGGIGIMNIMLVSVTERTREIGIRKAVGARRRDILTQFLIEAVTLTLIGGLAGIFLGMVMVALVADVDVGGLTLDPVISLDIVLLAIGFSAAVGIVFGLYPAQRAAKLNPIDALRYE
ncbi:MAG: ABC transporter permease [Anaerolineae bacterium]